MQQKNSLLNSLAIFLILLLAGGGLFYLSSLQDNTSITQKDTIIAVQKKDRKITPKKKNIKQKTYEESLMLIKERAGIAKKTEGIDIKLPSNDIFRLANSTDTNVEHWLQILNESERNYDKYLVIPKEGLVVPINYTKKDSADYKKFQNGQNIDVNSYLETGAFEIPATSKNDYGEVGNKVISGHSSFFTDKPGNYKTHFQKIIEMNTGDPIWIYQKNENEEYDRFVYITEKTYNTGKDDISILKPSGEKEVTLFTCTPIGGNSGRWVVKGKFLGKY